MISDQMVLVNGPIPSLVSRPSLAPVFDHLQYIQTKGESLVNLTTWFKDVTFFQAVVEICLAF